MTDDDLRGKLGGFVQKAVDYISFGEILRLNLCLSRPSHPFIEQLKLNPEETVLVIAILSRFLEGQTVK